MIDHLAFETSDELFINWHIFVCHVKNNAFVFLVIEFLACVMVILMPELTVCFL